MIWSTDIMWRSWLRSFTFKTWEALSSKTNFNANYDLNLIREPKLRRCRMWSQGFTTSPIVHCCGNFSPTCCCRHTKKKTSWCWLLAEWLKALWFCSTSARKEFHHKKLPKPWPLQASPLSQSTETKQSFLHKKQFTLIHSAEIFWKSVKTNFEFSMKLSWSFCFNNKCFDHWKIFLNRTVLSDFLTEIKKSVC